MWLGSSVGRVLARQARGPGFESRSGYDFSSPVTLRTDIIFSACFVCLVPTCNADAI